MSIFDNHDWLRELTDVPEARRQAAAAEQRATEALLDVARREHEAKAERRHLRAVADNPAHLYVVDGGKR